MKKQAFIKNNIKTLSFRAFSEKAVHEQRETRVRFAPSPTGNIHLGGLRAAFYNFLFAKQRNGKFILRIEDTDQARNVPGSADQIEDVLCWAGLKPDESPRVGGPHGPYVQSERLKLYTDLAQKLLEQGKAYKCFCSSARLYLLRKEQSRMRLAPHYDRRCFNLSASEIKQQMEENNGRYAIRFLLPEGDTSFDDGVFGLFSVNLLAKKESDPIIMRSDGYPTYHFANVVDDASMKITDVIRGSEWWHSTPKHIKIYEAFGWPVPKYIHFPLLKMEDGTKMSKRNKHSHVGEYIDSGYRPMALINFITQTGGGLPMDKQDLMQFWNFSDYTNGFDFTKLKKNPARLDYNRLEVYNSRELQDVWASDPDTLVKEFLNLLERNNIETDLDCDAVKAVIGSLICRISTLNTLLDLEYRFIWCRPKHSWSKQEYIDKGWDMVEILQDTISTVESIGYDDRDKFNSTLKELAKKHGVAYADYMKLIRKVLTNNEVGLPIVEITECLGITRTVLFLNDSLDYINS